MNAQESAKATETAADNKFEDLISSVTLRIEESRDVGKGCDWGLIKNSLMCGNEQRLLQYFADKGYAIALRQTTFLLEIGEGAAWTLRIAWTEEEKQKLKEETGQSKPKPEPEPETLKKSLPTKLIVELAVMTALFAAAVAALAVVVL